MIDRTEECIGIKPDWFVVETAYGSAENLAWLVKEREIIPFIPLIDKSERDGMGWDEDNDRYILPEGKHLNRTRQNHPDPRKKQPRIGRCKYWAIKYVCDICYLTSNYCPRTEAHTVTREEHDDARDFAWLATKSDFNPKAQAKRKKVEMRFAHLKRILTMGRLWLRGPCGAQDEFALAAIAQYFRKLTKLKPQAAETRIAI